MKRTVISFFLLLTLILNAQTYVFDNVITIEVNGKNQNQNIINSENDNYILFLKSENTAEIFDRITKIRHFFKVSYQVDDKISLEYVRSCDESQYFEVTRQKKWDFRVEKLNDNEFILAKYKSKKSKKSKCEIIIKIEESDLDNIIFLHSIEDEFIEILKPYLDSTKNYTIKEMHFSKGYSGNILKLKNVVQYDLKVELPQKLNYECQFLIKSIVIN